MGVLVGVNDAFCIERSRKVLASKSYPLSVLYKKHHYSSYNDTKS